jgi:diaminopimelate epimerase
VRFTKMQALGNDFVLLDARVESLPERMAQLCKRLCERRFGVGADQVLVLKNSQIADFGMRIFNADGSEVEMCGNGVRCLARHIWSRGLSTKDRLNIETAAGIIKPEREGELVRVDMGEPRLAAGEIPVELPGEEKGQVVDHPLRAGDREFAVTCVSMGNPHATVFVEDVEGFPVEEYGPLIENHRIFPNRTNVEFIQVMGRDEVRMRVWERGVGETLACGTGASATAVASSLKGLTDREVTVHLRGGDLNIEWGEDNRVYMTGPAAEVFEGDINL